MMQAFVLVILHLACIGDARRLTIRGNDTDDLFTMQRPQAGAVKGLANLLLTLQSPAFQFSGPGERTSGFRRNPSPVALGIWPVMPATAAAPIVKQAAPASTIEQKAPETKSVEATADLFPEEYTAASAVALLGIGAAVVATKAGENDEKEEKEGGEKKEKKGKKGGQKKAKEDKKDGPAVEISPEEKIRAAAESEAKSIIQSAEEEAKSILAPARKEASAFKTAAFHYANAKGFPMREKLLEASNTAKAAGVPCYNLRSDIATLEVERKKLQTEFDQIFFLDFPNRNSKSEEILAVNKQIQKNGEQLKDAQAIVDKACADENALGAETAKLMMQVTDIISAAGVTANSILAVAEKKAAAVTEDGMSKASAVREAADKKVAELIAVDKK